MQDASRRMSIVVGGDAEQWHVFREDTEGEAGVRAIERFRAFACALDPARDGVLKIGSTAVCTHFGDIVRLLGIPAVFAAAPPGGALPVLAEALRDGARRDRVRALVRASGVTADSHGNVRSGRFNILDQIDGRPAWVAWKPGARVCLSGFRVELLDTGRAGMHIRVGVPVEGSPLDARGYRTEPPRFISSAKIRSDGVFAVAPCDPIDPLRPISGGTTGDRYEDAMLVFALRAFYGCPEDGVKALLLGEGACAADPPPYACRRAA